MQVEDAGGNNVPDQQEDAGDNEDSILENLSPLSGDASSMESEEYNCLMKEMEDKEKIEVESAPPKQVLATVMGLEEDSDSENTPPPPTPQFRVRPIRVHRIGFVLVLRRSPIKDVALTLVKGFQWRNSRG
jgi:hypothetical protein